MSTRRGRISVCQAPWPALSSSVPGSAPVSHPAHAASDFLASPHQSSGGPRWTAPAAWAPAAGGPRRRGRSAGGGRDKSAAAAGRWDTKPKGSRSNPRIFLCSLEPSLALTSCLMACNLVCCVWLRIMATYPGMRNSRKNWGRIRSTDLGFFKAYYSSPLSHRLFSSQMARR